MVCNVSHLRISDGIEERLNKRHDNRINLGDAIKRAKEGKKVHNRYAKITFADGIEMQAQVVEISKKHGIKVQTMLIRLSHGRIKFANGWKIEPVYEVENEQN